MHSRTIDAARTAACWRDDPAPEPRVSVGVWVVPLIVFWVIVGLAVM